MMYDVKSRTLCDPIYHVNSRSSEVILITNCYVRVYFTLLYDRQLSSQKSQTCSRSHHIYIMLEMSASSTNTSAYRRQLHVRCTHWPYLTPINETPFECRSQTDPEKNWGILNHFLMKTAWSVVLPQYTRITDHNDRRLTTNDIQYYDNISVSYTHLTLPTNREV